MRSSHEDGDVALPFEPAARWRRTVATTVDFLLVAFGLGLIIALAAGPERMFGSEQVSAPLWTQIVYQVALPALLVLYATTSMSRSGLHNGQTFGKQLLRIHVTRHDGSPLSWRASLLRESSKWLPLTALSHVPGADGVSAAVFVIVFGAAFIDRSRRTLYDRALRSEVLADD